MDKLTAYRILGLERDADFRDIRKAYKELVNDVHPEEDPERFSEIQSAYRYLLRLNSRERSQEPDNRTDRNTVSSDYPEEQDELTAFFESVTVEANEAHNADITREQDLDTVNALRNRRLCVTDVSPDYLTYLLKTYPLRETDYGTIYAGVVDIRESEKRKLRADITRPEGFLIRTAVYFFVSLTIAFVGKAGLLYSGRLISVNAVYFAAVLITAVIMFFSYRSAKAKKDTETGEKLLSDIYSESIGIICEKRNVIPAGRREMFIACLLALANMIPFMISPISNIGIVWNLFTVLFYYVARKQWIREACGIFELIITLFFQLIAYLSMGSGDYGRFIIPVFLAVNSGLLIYKFIKLVIRRKSVAQRLTPDEYHRRNILNAITIFICASAAAAAVLSISVPRMGIRPSDALVVFILGIVLNLCGRLLKK